MSDADKAYAAAEAEIARVKAAGETTLDLDYSHYNALTDLPPEIAELTALTWINLGNTQITSLTPIAGLKALKGLEIDNTQVTVLDPIAGMKDMETLTLVNTRVSRLEPIAGLTALSRLWIGGTGVTDLRPIRALERLGESDWPLDGLHFENTPFADANDETRRLAAITDRHERTRKTLAFLNTLPPPPAPLPWEADAVHAKAASDAPVPPPEQDPSLPLIWGEHGFQFLAEHIGIDPVTRAALTDLRALLETLRRQAGNRHEDLYQLAQEMLDRAEPVNGTLDAVPLHLSFQKLERLHAVRDTREHKLDDEIVTTLGSILTVAPGVTLADEQVHVLIRRQDANRANPPPGIDKARADAVLDAVQQPEAPFAPEVQDLAASAQGDGDDRVNATKTTLAWNVIVAAGRFFSHTIPATLVANWLWANRTALLSAAHSMGTDAAVWLTRILQDIGAGLGGLTL